MIILIFGDSIGCGFWDEGGGWVTRLKRWLGKKVVASDLNFTSAVYNLSVDGDTSEGVLQRFVPESKPRLWAGEEIMTIFALGINDSEFLNGKKELRILPERFRVNLDRLIQKAKKISSKIIFVGLTPVDDEKVDPIPWAPKKSYKNENVKKYNQIIKDVCLKNKVDFIEIFEKFIKMDYKKLLIDGVHPNTAGHELIFEIIKDYLIKKKII